MGIYERFLRKHPDLSTAELADIIARSGEVNAEMASIKGRIRATRCKLNRKDPGWRDKGYQPEDNAEEPEEPEIVGDEVPPDIEIQQVDRDGDSYEISWEERAYCFFIRRAEEYGGLEVIVLRFPVVQAIFEWYTHPYALTAKATINKVYQEFGVELTHRQFKRIKTVLSLVKGSNPIAPHVHYENVDEEKVGIYLETAEAKLETKIRASEPEHWRKLYEKEKKKSIRVERFFERVKDALPEINPPKQKPLPRSWDLNPTDVILIVSDWHVGKLVERDFNRYNQYVFRSYMQQLKRQIKEHFVANVRPVERLHICAVGDLVDGIAGNMHPKQDRNQDIHGAKQVLVAGLALSDLVAFCSTLIPDIDIQVEYISGNHDRISKHRKGDPDRVAGEMVFYMARETCTADNVEWNLHQHVVGEFKPRNTQVFLTHGDLSPKDYRKLVFARQDKSAEDYLVISGHYHHLKIMEDLNMMSVTGGSLPGKTDYSVDRLGLGARPSQAMLEVRDDGPRPLIWLPLGK